MMLEKLIVSAPRKRSETPGCKPCKHPHANSWSGLVWGSSYAINPGEVTGAIFFSSCPHPIPQTWLYLFELESPQLTMLGILTTALLALSGSLVNAHGSHSSPQDPSADWATRHMQGGTLGTLQEISVNLLTF